MELRVVPESFAKRDLIIEKIRKKIKQPCQRILMVHPMQIKKENFYLDRALSRRYWAFPPYGCGVLCRNLQARGYTTDILDLNLEMLQQAYTLKDAFDYDFWQRRLLTYIDSFNPDLIGISCMFSMSHQIMKDISQAIKNNYPDMPVIIGGVHPSNASHLVLKDCPHIDFLGPHEADKSFPDLIDFINKKLPEESVSQIATIVDGEYLVIKGTPPHEEIEAAPLYHSLPIREYNTLGQVGSYEFLRPGRPASSVLSRRGCIAMCSFCSVHEFNGPGIRSRSVKNILDEIKYLYDIGIRHIVWVDDDLLSVKNRALELLNGIADLKLDLTWDASNGLIAAFVTPEVMDAIARSGCIGYNLGIESGTPEILRSVHKPGTLDSFRKAKKQSDRYPHIFVKGFIMLGFPEETFRQILNTINFCVELDLDWYSIQILNLLPSTEIYQDLLEKGLIEDNIATSDIAYVFGPSSPQRRREIQEKTITRNFSDLFATRDLDSVPTKDELMDCSIIMDYRVNYEKVVRMTETIKIQKALSILTDISTRIAPEGPLAHLFKAVAHQKLGQKNQAQAAMDVSKNIVSESVYWQKRFDALGINLILTDLEKKL